MIVCDLWPRLAYGTRLAFFSRTLALMSSLLNTVIPSSGGDTFSESFRIPYGIRKFGWPGDFS